jgi:hypothetical protein
MSCLSRSQKQNHLLPRRCTRQKQAIRSSIIAMLSDRTLLPHRPSVLQSIQLPRGIQSQRLNKIAKVKMVLQFIENGSNSMTTYQALMAAANSQNDSLSVIQNGTTLVATISNVAPMMLPVRIMTNGLAATSALIRIATDWKDPNKKVQAGDVLTVISAVGTIAVTLLVWAEIGPGAAAVVGGLILAADLQSSFQPYINSTKIWLGNYMTNLLRVSNPCIAAQGGERLDRSDYYRRRSAVA